MKNMHNVINNYTLLKKKTTTTQKQNGDFLIFCLQGFSSTFVGRMEYLCFTSA